MRLLIAILTFLTANSILFAGIPERPVPTRFVNDFASVLSNKQKQQMEDHLMQFAHSTSTQIIVVTVSSLEGYSCADYTSEIEEKWGIVQKGKNNELVILLKPKTNNSKEDIFISTSNNLKNILPDSIINNTVVDKEMTPHFCQNDYYGGLAAGLDIIMSITKNKYTAEKYQQKISSGKRNVSVLVLLIFIIVVVFVARIRKSRFYSPGKKLPFWLSMRMLSGNNSSSVSFLDFSSGNGIFSGLTRKNIGGLAVDNLGGGGAGGSW